MSVQAGGERLKILNTAAAGNICVKSVKPHRRRTKMEHLKNPEKNL